MVVSLLFVVSPVSIGYLFQLHNTIFDSKRDVMIWLIENSVREKKPFCISKNDTKRILVTFTEKSWAFKTNVYIRKGGKFHVATQAKHTCASGTQTIQKCWLREKAVELLIDRGKVKSSDFACFFCVTFGVTVLPTILKTALKEARKMAFRDDESFG